MTHLTKAQVRTAILTLRDLAKPGSIPARRHCGICSNLRLHALDHTPWSAVVAEAAAWSAVVAEAAASWEEFSGDFEFPVPHDELEAELAYDTENLWEGAYGDSRRRLCLHVAQWLEDNYGVRHD